MPYNEFYFISLTHISIPLSFNIWYDYCGTEAIFMCSFSLQFRALAPMYYRGSAAAIIVYDITKEVN